MLSPFLLYDFKTGTIAGLSDGGPYGGRRIDGLGSSCARQVFPDVEVVWRYSPKCDYDEAASFMGVVVRRPVSTGVVIRASLLQEGASALPEEGKPRSAFSSLVAFCRAKGIAAPSSFAEALPLVHGWYSQGQVSLAAVRSAEEATTAETAKRATVTRALDDYKRDTKAEIEQLKSDLETS